MNIKRKDILKILFQLIIKEIIINNNDNDDIYNE